MLNGLKLLLPLLFIQVTLCAQEDDCAIMGSVKDEASKEPIAFAKVIASQNGEPKGFTATDFDGRFLIRSLAPGMYDIEVRFVGYSSFSKKEVHVTSGRPTVLNDAMLLTEADTIDIIEVTTLEFREHKQDSVTQNSTKKERRQKKKKRRKMERKMSKQR